MSFFRSLRSQSAISSSECSDAEVSSSSLLALVMFLDFFRNGGTTRELNLPFLPLSSFLPLVDFDILLRCFGSINPSAYDSPSVIGKGVAGNCRNLSKYRCGKYLTVFVESPVS